MLTINRLVLREENLFFVGKNFKVMAIVRNKTDIFKQTNRRSCQSLWTYYKAPAAAVLCTSFNAGILCSLGQIAALVGRLHRLRIAIPFSSS